MMSVSTVKIFKQLLVICLLVVQPLLNTAANAADDYLEVIVTDPFIEMHSGPASGYPVFHVVDRGTRITILKQKTDWFKIRLGKGKKIKEGWVHRNELSQTLTLDGKKPDFSDPTIEDFRKRRWEMGIMAGDFDGAASFTAYGAFYLWPTLSVELSGAQNIGNFSSSLIAQGRVLAHPFPEWRVSPYFGLGTGLIQINPNATLVQTIDRTDTISSVVLGTNIYLTKRFILRLEVNQYKVLTERNENEEVTEWKAGFAAFF